MYKGLLTAVLSTLCVVLLAGCAAKPAPPAQAQAAPAVWKDYWCYSGVHDPDGINNTVKLCFKGNLAFMGVYFSDVATEPTFCQQTGTKQTLPDFVSLMFGPGICKNGHPIASSLWECQDTGETFDCRNVEEGFSLILTQTSKPDPS
ncbi:MAG: hypothetical protein ACN6O6_19640 [Pseudomonas sp.]|uniref:hypothetical protein n=1 Tax=Pseudomonas sp. TaxID=306 RepID=UPI003D0A0174